jgi:hypothetical protein
MLETHCADGRACLGEIVPRLKAADRLDAAGWPGGAQLRERARAIRDRCLEVQHLHRGETS